MAGKRGNNQREQQQRQQQQEEEEEEEQQMEVSVKCPDSYKDAAIQDIMNTYFYDESDQAIVICWSRNQAEKLLKQTQFFSSERLYACNLLSREQRVNIVDSFLQNKSTKCLIATGISHIMKKGVEIRVLIFMSPPKNHEIYISTVKSLKQIDIIVVCYNSSENRDLQRLQKNLGRTLRKLDPPPVTSDDEFEENPEKAKYEKDTNTRSTTTNKNPGETKNANLRIIVKNIPKHSNWSTLKGFFSQHSVLVRKIQFPKNLQTFVKVAYVVCIDESHLKKALKLSGIFFKKNKLVIEKFIPDPVLPEKNRIRHSEIDENTLMWLPASLRNIQKSQQESSEMEEEKQLSDEIQQQPQKQ